MIKWYDGAHCFLCKGKEKVAAEASPMFLSYSNFVGGQSVDSFNWKRELSHTVSFSAAYFKRQADVLPIHLALAWIKWSAMAPPCFKLFLSVFLEYSPLLRCSKTIGFTSVLGLQVRKSYTTPASRPVMLAFKHTLSYNVRMQTLPQGFSEISLTALPLREREALLRLLSQNTHARGLRFRSDARPSSAVGVTDDMIPWAQNAYYVEEEARPGISPLHDAGAYYLQEPSAMAPVMALDVTPGCRALDLCAAPGGKATQIGALLAGEGVLVANEIVPSRAKILSQNIERMGIANTIVTNARPEALALAWPGWFDRVLVDAPCSGEGMFRREPAARLAWTKESPAGCALRQRAILQSAGALVAEGGLLVYSTCTFNEIENEQVVQAFLRDHPDFSAEDFTLPGVGASAEGCLRLWPHRLLGEGHFIARLRKQGVSRPIVGDRASFDLSTVLDDGNHFTMPGTVQRLGEHVWLLPSDAPPLEGIRVLRFGLCVAEQRGRMARPDHALSHALPPGAFSQVYSADQACAEAYLRGETLPASGLSKGFVLVSFDGFGLGFAKYVDGSLKNHLPKGLRRPLARLR